MSAGEESEVVKQDRKDGEDTSAVISNDKLVRENLLKRESIEKKTNSDSESENGSKAKKRRGLSPWKLCPPPQPFKKAKYAWQIKNYEHTVACMKLSIDSERREGRNVSSSCGAGARSCATEPQPDSILTNTAPSYANIYHNNSYPSNLYNPLLRWSKLSQSNEEGHVNRFLQSFLFPGDEAKPQNPEIHPLLMLSLAEADQSRDASPNQHPQYPLNNPGLLSQVTAPYGATTPVGMNSPPTSEYDSSSDDTSLGEEILPDHSLVQQHLHYQYQQQQNFNELMMNQSNATAAMAFCKRLQQAAHHQTQDESQQLFLQNRQLLNLHLQSLCEKMQAHRNTLPFNPYLASFNNPAPEYTDDTFPLGGGLESFRRNTPSETESEHTTAVPLVSNSSSITEDTRCFSRTSDGAEAKEAPHPPPSRLHYESDLSLSEDSYSEVGVAEEEEELDSDPEEELRQKVETEEKGSGDVVSRAGVKCDSTDVDLTCERDSHSRSNNVATNDGRKSALDCYADDDRLKYSRSKNSCDESCDCVADDSKPLGGASLVLPQPTDQQLTATVLTCNCVIANERSSPSSSVSSNKSLDDSASSLGGTPPMPLDCPVAGTKKCPDGRDASATDKACSDSEKKYYFDQAFHLLKQQNMTFQQA